MTGEAQTAIQRFIYHLSTENFAHANKELSSFIKNNVQTKFDNAYQAEKNSAKAKTKQK